MRRYPGPGRCPFSQVVQTLVPSWCPPGSLSDADSRIHPHSGCTKVPPHEVTGPHIARHTDAQTRVWADQHTPYTLTLTQTEATLTYTEIPFLAHTRSFTWNLPPHLTHAGTHTDTQACFCPQRHIHTERYFPTGLTQTSMHTHSHTLTHTLPLTDTDRPHSPLRRLPLADPPTRRHALTHAAGALVVSSAAAAVTLRSLGPVWTVPHHFLLQGFQLQTRTPDSLPRLSHPLSNPLLSTISPSVQGFSLLLPQDLLLPVPVSFPLQVCPTPSPRSGLNHPSCLFSQSVLPPTQICLLSPPRLVTLLPLPRSPCYMPSPRPGPVTLSSGSILLSLSSPTSGPLEPQLVLIRRGRGETVHWGLQCDVNPQPPPLTHTHSLCVYRTWEQGEHGRGKRWAEGESQGNYKGRVLQEEAEEWLEVQRGSWGSWHLAGLLPQLPVPGPGRGRDQKDNTVRRGLQKADWPRSGGRRG